MARSFWHWTCPKKTLQVACPDTSQGPLDPARVASGISYLETIAITIPIDLLNPLVNQQFAIEHGPVEIVDFPINSMVIFHCKMLVHQRVNPSQPSPNTILGQHELKSQILKNDFWDSRLWLVATEPAQQP